MTGGDRVLIIGGGIIGLTSAYYLERAGFRVTIIEQDAMAGACSRSNCGFICPSHVLPLTEPGALAMGVKSMFSPHAPFRIKPRLDPALWGWLLQFARRCRHDPMVQAGHALQQILEASADQYRELVATERLDCEWREDGLLYVLRTQHGLEEFARTDDLVTTEFGVRARRLDAQALQAFDPAFREELAGAFLYEGDASVRPERLARSLVELLASRGVNLIEHRGLKRVKRERNRIVAAETSAGDMEADHYLLATGAWAAQWQDELECRLPVQPGKGYSITLDRPATSPQHPTLFPEHRVAVTPFQDAIRLGSIMEFSGFDSSIRESRLALLRDSANLYVNEPLGGPARESWFGWRPMTYDSLPIIGPAPRLDNLVLAVGHNMLGMSLAPATGRLVAELLSGSEPHIDPAPYRPARFA